LSKNEITIDQLKLACRHSEEMKDADLTENMAIRTLELFADLYAKFQVVGNASPHHRNQFKLWSRRALELKKKDPNSKSFRCEHGTPRRGFARKVQELYKQGNLNLKNMNLLVERYWKVAVITVDEDRVLNSRKLRSEMLATPEERWEKAGIKIELKRD
jgi:hypothetical protein